MNRKTNIPAPVGGSSLLVIFSVLCFSVFSILVLATVKADERLADAGFEAVTAYYEADCEAERILGELRAGVVEDGVTQNGQIYTYQCPVNDTQSLNVVVEITDEAYEIHEWRLQETVDWKPDEYIELVDVEDLVEE